MAISNDINVDILTCDMCDLELSKESISSRICDVCETPIPLNKLVGKLKSDFQDNKEEKYVALNIDSNEMNFEEFKPHCSYKKDCKSGDVGECSALNYEDDDDDDDEDEDNNDDDDVDAFLLDHKEFVKEDLLNGAWKCKLCTLINGKDVNVCRACNSWKCKECTYINNDTVLECAACGCNLIKIKGNSDNNVPIENDETKWACRKCSCLNETSITICMACFSWRCKTCTFINERYCLTCDICQEKKEDRNLINDNNNAPPSDKKTWKCLNCQCINSDDSRICTSCGWRKCRKCMHINKKNFAKCVNCGYERKFATKTNNKNRKLKTKKRSNNSKKE